MSDDKSRIEVERDMLAQMLKHPGWEVFKRRVVAHMIAAARDRGDTALSEADNIAAAACGGEIRALKSVGDRALGVLNMLDAEANARRETAAAEAKAKRDASDPFN